MPEQLERQLFSASQHPDHGFLHSGIRSDGGSRGKKRKEKRYVIREQDREDEVTEEGRDGGREATKGKKTETQNGGNRDERPTETERQFELKII